MTRVSTCILFLFLSLFLNACDEEGTQTTAEAQSAAPASTWFPLSVDKIKLDAQVAVTQSEQQRGLMYRQSLAADHGMLFPYRQPRRQSFWMKNTNIPLDVGYFDTNGVLAEIHPLYPHDQNPVKSKRSDLRYALEVNRGWFAEHDLKPGAQLDMRQVADALEARGFEAAPYVPQGTQ